jgi:Alginate lyase
MKRCIAAKCARVAAVLLLLGTYCAGEQAKELPRVFVLRPDALLRVRTAVRTTKLESPAITAIRADAEQSLKVSSLSVTDKPSAPPSGDKHDYMSLAPYWWPDPKSPNGLPYIRRDGERNPELSSDPDHKNFDKLISTVRKLALGYYVLGDEKYADKATLLLRTWFIDPRTRMNPNLQYAQAVKGHNDGRGTGLIETRSIGNVVDAVGLLAGSRAWTDADQRAMNTWCGSFLDWMLTSNNGKDEAAARNNHGSFYDAQVAALALFVDRTDVAHEVLSSAAHRRIETQVEPDGSQPLELARTKSFSYSSFNLTALFELARLGDSVGVDLWSFRSKDGRSIRAALDYLLPYATGERKWTHQQIEPMKPQELVPLLLEAAVRFKAPEYRVAALKIDSSAAASTQALFLDALSSTFSSTK